MKSVSCSPAGPSSRAFIDRHGVRVGGARTVAPAASRAAIVAARIGDLERDPDVAGDAPADLDPIDELGLGRIGDLERRATRLEDHHPPVGRAVRLAFGQAEDVAIEPDGVVVVGRRDDEAQLADRTRIGGGHGASLACDRAPHRAPRKPA